VLWFDSRDKQSVPLSAAFSAFLTPF